MYRDDVCAVCGESLPPDHVYCRRHAAEVDGRLRALGERLPRLLAEVDAVQQLLAEVAQETFDWLAEQEDDDPEWPPRAVVELRADGDAVDVTVDAEPGMVRLRADPPLHDLLAALRDGLDAESLRRFAAACRAAQGANATH